jgi:hypothetical protein
MRRLALVILFALLASRAHAGTLTEQQTGDFQVCLQQSLGEFHVYVTATTLDASGAVLRRVAGDLAPLLTPAQHTAARAAAVAALNALRTQRGLPSAGVTPGAPTVTPTPIPTPTS